MASSGYVGASQINRVLAKGEGKTRWSYMAELIAARLSGVSPETYKSWEMQRGHEIEEEAIAAYEFERDVKVERLGFVPHPKIEWAGATPDGRVVGTKGLVEFKCPNISTHIDTLMGAKIKREYQLQMQFQMACTGAQWVDWCSYEPRLPEHMSLHICRVKRDKTSIEEIEAGVVAFLSELDTKLDALLSMYGESNILTQRLEASVA